MEMLAILILQALILRGGDNIEILPNPSTKKDTIAVKNDVKNWEYISLR